MYLKKNVVERRDAEEKESSARMWRAKLWEGDWEEFIKQTDAKFTKSNPVVSRLEMLKNAIEFGFPTLALKIFKSKSLVEMPIEESPRSIRHLSKFQDMMDHQTPFQFLTAAFGNPYDVLAGNKIKDKGEHLFYLLNSGAEESDINDFIQARFLKGLSLEDYMKDHMAIEPELSFEDYMSLTYVCLWFNDTTTRIQNLLSDFWFRKFKQDMEQAKEKKIFKPSETGSAFENLKEHADEVFCFQHCYPLLSVSKIGDNSELDGLYNELRPAIDHYSFLAKKNKSELYLSEIQDYVYKQKLYENGEVRSITKKDFYSEKISTKQDVLKNLYMSFLMLHARVDAKICPV